MKTYALLCLLTLSGAYSHGAGAEVDTSISYRFTDATNDDDCYAKVAQASLQMMRLQKLFRIPDNFEWRAGLSGRKVWWKLLDSDGKQAGYELNIRVNYHDGICVMLGVQDGGPMAYLRNIADDHSVVDIYSVGRAKEDGRAKAKIRKPEELERLQDLNKKAHSTAEERSLTLRNRKTGDGHL